MGELAIVCRHLGAASDGSTELGVVGPVTHATTPPLRDHLRLVIGASTSPRLRLNLSCCTNIDLDGMVALSAARQVARDCGGDLHLVNVPPLIERQLRHHDFEDLIRDPRAADR